MGMVIYGYALALVGVHKALVADGGWRPHLHVPVGVGEIRLITTILCDGQLAQ